MLLTVTILVPERAWRAAAPATQSYIMARAAALFGGASLSAGLSTFGVWEDPQTGATIEEEHRSLYIGIDTLGDVALVVAYARELGAALRQHSVHVSALGFAENVEVGS